MKAKKELMIIDFLKKLAKDLCLIIIIASTFFAKEFTNRYIGKKQNII